MYVNVIIRNKARFSDILFTYEVDPVLQKYIKPGHRVSVPFGKSNKPIEAVVVEIKKRLTKDIDESKIKRVVDILDENPILTVKSIELLFWMRERYMCTYADVLNLFYPKGYGIKSKKMLKVSERYDGDENLGKTGEEILSTLMKNNGVYEYSRMSSLFSEYSINSLRERGIIEVFWEYKNRKNEKVDKVINLKYPAETVYRMAAENKLRLGVRQKELIDFLDRNRDVYFRDLSDLMGITSNTVESLEKRNFISVEEVDVFRRPENKFSVQNREIRLNEEQQNVLDELIKGFITGNNKPFLLKGVTGSGKTEVYLKYIEFILKQGMECVFLVPEIALTPMMISRVKNRFGNLVGVYHSALSEGEKHDVFRLAANGDISIVIGTRSALFMPFHNLGLVIIDEEHETSYKSDMTPKYDSLEVARYMAYKNNISVVMGSATPAISDYYKAEKGEYNLVEIKRRANERPLPKIETVDMKEEMKTGNDTMVSSVLWKEIEETISRGEQVILFLNRRGYANVVCCKNCGYVFRCSHCDISMTYHRYNNKNICHYCGKEEILPDRCPECSSIEMDILGTGTERVEELVRMKHPEYRIKRVDRDVISRKGKLEEILTDFDEGKIDILIGTQILSKGHDFPNVTLVGIISADMMLNYPDYRAFETTFQLISQVSGRAGRGDKEGKVILQSYDCDHFAIRKAIEHDYEGFYSNDIKLRETFGYEPFNNILRVVFSGINEMRVKDNISRFHKSLEYLFGEEGRDIKGSILGPNQCSVSKIKDKYRWQVILKDLSMDIKKLKSMVKYLCVTKFKDIFDEDILISIEVNPNSFI